MSSRDAAEARGGATDDAAAGRGPAWDTARSLPSSTDASGGRPSNAEAVAGGPSSEEAAGGRVYFSSVRRSLEVEDEIVLVSVGVDIGSSTSHLVFSRLVMERQDNRYVVAERTVLHESEVLLTPYVDASDDAGPSAGNAAGATIDADALRAFVDRQYALAGVTPAQVDSGALILTGVAVRRRNARAIGELFAAQAGRFVAVSAGDALETTLSAFGSGAAARSIRDGTRVMNIDIGGGTSKIAVCEAGAVVEQTAIDIGARIVAFDDEGRVVRIEAAGHRLADEAGVALRIGDVPDAGGIARLVGRMADHLMAAARGAPGEATTGLLRLDPLSGTRPPDVLTFSGGVAEYLYGREAAGHGDLGDALAQAVLQRVAGWGPRLEASAQGIRATVVGASQYTVQVSGGTIFVEPAATLPLRNVPVIVPAFPLQDEVLDAAAIAAAVRAALRAMDLDAAGAEPVAMFYRWQGSATFGRLDAFCRGVADGLAARVARSAPLVLIGDGDIGGLIGIHLHRETRVPAPVVSIDGITLQAFSFIDIGALLETSGAVPVVIKSLVFPASAALGRAA